MIWRSLILGLAALALIAGCFGQETKGLAPSKPEVVLTKLGPIVYPQIAWVAHISGDIELVLDVNQYGKILSAKAVSGPVLLRRAALTSAQQSQFECRQCVSGATSTRVLYSFELIERNDCCDATSNPQVSHSRNHITIVDRAYCTCDPVAVTGKRRSWKCLYLWHCAR